MNHLETGVAALSVLSLDAIATANATAANVAMAGFSLTGAAGLTNTTALTVGSGTGAASGAISFQTNGTERLGVAFAGRITIPDAVISSSVQSQVYLPVTMTNSSYAGLQGPLITKGTGRGNQGVTGKGLAGQIISMADGAGVVNKTITGATNASPIVVTSAAHGFSNGDLIVVYGVVGNTAANAAWTVASATTDTFALAGSTGNGAYTSGGTATNRPYMVGLYVAVNPVLTRNTGMTVANGLANCDDVAPIIVQNIGTGKANEAFYVAAASNVVSGAGYQAALSIGGKVDKGIQFGQAVTSYGIDFWHASTATYGSGTIRIPNGSDGRVVGRNAADNADVNLFFISSSDRLTFLEDTEITDGKNIYISGTTGTKIGHSTGSKIGFFNATPIVQPSNTTGIRTALINLGLLASGGATPLDLNGGTLTAAKGVFGTNAATTGVIGIPNGSAVYARNNANNADVVLFTLNTSDQMQVTPVASFLDDIRLADGKNFVPGSTNGAKIGTDTTQKIGFHNSTPVVQRAGAAQAAVAATGATITTPYGYTTAAQADAIVTLVNEIRATLVEKGLMKGAA